MGFSPATVTRLIARGSLSRHGTEPRALNESLLATGSCLVMGGRGGPLPCLEHAIARLSSL